MKLNRLISRVQVMLERAENLEEIARLTNLLLSLQRDYIQELEKKLAPTNRRKLK